MFRFFQIVLSGWFTLSLITSVVAEKMVLAKQTQCPHANLDRKDECTICVEKANESHKLGQTLIDYVHHGAISFNDSGTKYLSWHYDDYVVNDPYNITVSFNLWHHETHTGKALRGCCGIPLSRGGCYVRDCVQGITFLTVTYKQWTAAKVFSLDSMSSCVEEEEEERPSARYFTICVHELTNWRERYNCECAVYDSYTGALKPGNHTSELGKNKTEVGVWYSDEEEPKQYQVCVFSMRKDDVMARGSLADDNDVIDSVAFNRGVFYMKNFSGFNGSVIDDFKGRNVNCTILTFKGGEIFNISSIHLSNHPHRKFNNDTYTCLAPWPNGTPEYKTQGTHVKCMPQNATYTMSHVYEKKMMTPNSFVSTMAVFIPLLGAVAVMAVVCVLGLTLRKKFNKFMKEMKDFPEELDTVMKESYSDFASRLSSSCDEEKEQCQAFDREEKDHILSLRQKEDNTISRQLKNNLIYDSIQQQNGRPPSFLDLRGVRSNMRFDNEIMNSNCVACHSGIKNFNPDTTENDSGCRISIGMTSDDEPSSPDVPYMVRHVPDDETCKKANPMLELKAENLKQISMVVCDVPCDGYRTKLSFRKKNVPDTISRCSNDTGCGSDSENEEESFLETLDYGMESKKHPFFKSSSKDSGVVTNMCANSLRDSMSDISDDMIDEEFDYSPKTFQEKYPEHIIVSCITAH